MKKLLLFSVFILCFSFSKAQWVTIPDANFVAWLQANYPSCMNGNLMDTTCNAIVNETGINCQSQNISDLSGVQYFDNLQYLSFASNSISTLPILPSSLVLLSGLYNQLISLPPLPNTLEDLEVESNQLTSLPPLPNSLIYLNCGYNQLATLPALPSSLYMLSCFGNNLSNLPILPNSLDELNCQQNLLTNLPLISNQVTKLHCAGNQIESLPNLPLVLLELDCSYNIPLTCLPLLPSSLTDLNFSFTSVTCVPNFVSIANCNPLLSSLPICDLFNPSGCNPFWNISGEIYFDANSNCVYDSNDITELNIPVQLWQNGNLLQQTFTVGGGTYSFDVNSFGTYDVKIDTTTLPFSVLCPNSGVHTSVISAVDSMDSNADFSLVCKPDYDVAVNSIVVDSGAFIPGRKCLAEIHAGDLANFYGANCMNGIGGQVQLVINGATQYIGYVAGSLAPTTVTGNTIIWNIADFGAVDFFHDFHIRLLTDTAATLGSTICFDVTVSSSPADVNVSNNTLNYCFTVVSSFDPNFKEVNPIAPLATENDWLTYTIHFQNTGTASAQHIQIIDTLDSDFDISTFQYLGASHNCMAQVLEGGVVKFNFANINLPDSTTDEPNSHGWVQYRIKIIPPFPDGGAFMDNTAYIYFDFNAPVVTNTTHSVIWGSVNELANNFQFDVFPNPFSNQLTVFSKQLAGTTITVTDILGREVFRSQTNLKSVICNLQSLLQGIYFLKATNKNGETSVRKIIRQ